MKIKWPIIFSLSVGLIALVGIIGKYTSETNLNEDLIYCKYVDEITKPFIDRVYQEQNFRLVGGGGSFIHNVKLISLSFDKAIDDVEVSESRVWLVNCVEEMLKAVNEKKELHPYLDHFPFTNKGIKLSLMFNYNYTKNNRAVAHVLNYDGKVYYSYYDPEEDQLKDLHQETYEEAVRIVREQGRLAP